MEGGGLDSKRGFRRAGGKAHRFQDDPCEVLGVEFAGLCPAAGGVGVEVLAVHGHLSERGGDRIRKELVVGKPATRESARVYLRTSV